MNSHTGGHRKLADPMVYFKCGLNGVPYTPCQAESESVRVTSSTERCVYMFPFTGAAIEILPTQLPKTHHVFSVYCRFASALWVNAAVGSKSASIYCCCFLRSERTPKFWDLDSKFHLTSQGGSMRVTKPFSSQ